MAVFGDRYVLVIPVLAAGILSDFLLWSLKPTLERRGRFYLFAECGYLVVPEVRSQPESPAIQLAVAILKSPSTDPAPDPVIFLAGGPGDSGLAWVDTFRRSAPGQLGLSSRSGAKGPIHLPGRPA